MIEATVTGMVCADAPQSSREVGNGLTHWTLTLQSSPRDGRLPERVEVSWVSERQLPFDSGDDVVARGELRVCTCGAALRFVMRASDVREIHADTRARYAEVLRLAAEGGSDAA